MHISDDDGREIVNVQYDNHTDKRYSGALKQLLKQHCQKSEAVELTELLAENRRMRIMLENCKCQNVNH